MLNIAKWNTCLTHISTGPGFDPAQEKDRQADRQVARHCEARMILDSVCKRG